MRLVGRPSSSRLARRNSCSLARCCRCRPNISSRSPADVSSWSPVVWSMRFSNVTPFLFFIVLKSKGPDILLGSVRVDAGNMPNYITVIALIRCETAILPTVILIVGRAAHCQLSLGLFHVILTASLAGVRNSEECFPFGSKDSSCGCIIVDFLLSLATARHVIPQRFARPDHHSLGNRHWHRGPPQKAQSHVRYIVSAIPTASQSLVSV